jgi:hypothetical protein
VSEGRRFCENCGTEIRQTTNFCPNCGAAQSAASEEPTGSPVEESGPRRIHTPSAPVPPPPQAGRRGRLGTAGKGCLVIVAIVVALIVLAAILGGHSNSPSTPLNPGSTSGDTTPTGSGTKGETSPHFGDGTQRVGSDIQAGTYRTRKGSAGCYYARLSGFSGGVEDILANDNTDDPAVVTIEPTDTGFESRSCGTWTQDLSQITDSTTSFKDGTYIIGTDVEPGTYRSSGSSGCYYARLSGFDGDPALHKNYNQPQEERVCSEPNYHF